MTKLVAWFHCKMGWNPLIPPHATIKAFRLDEVIAFDSHGPEGQVCQVHLTGGLSFYMSAEDSQRLKDALLNPLNGFGYSHN